MSVANSNICFQSVSQPPLVLQNLFIPSNDQYDFYVKSPHYWSIMCMLHGSNIEINIGHQTRRNILRTCNFTPKVTV